MKKLIMITALMLSPSLAFAETVNVSVNGLVCSFCATAIEKTFKQKGVNDIDVNLKDKYVKFEMPEGIVLTDEEITQTVTDAGYAVTEIERK